MPAVVQATPEEIADKSQKENEAIQKDLKDASTTTSIKFFNQQDGFGRPKGIYLDRVEREQQEVVRAKLEGREPDLDNPPVSAGTPFVVQALVADNRNEYLIAETEKPETVDLEVEVTNPDTDIDPFVHISSDKLMRGGTASPEFKTVDPTPPVEDKDVEHREPREKRTPVHHEVNKK